MNANRLPEKEMFDILPSRYAQVISCMFYDKDVFERNT